MIKRSKRLSALILILLFGRLAAAESLIQSVQVLGQTGYFSFEAESTTKRKTSVSGYGAHGIFAEFAMKDRFKVSAGLTFTLSSGFTGDTSTGYDLAGKYFFMSNASPKSISYDSVTWYSSDNLRPYVGVGVRNREFFAVLSTTYVGPGVLAGIDYSYSRDFYLNAEARYDYLTGNEGNKLTQINFVVGIGFFLK